MIRIVFWIALFLLHGAQVIVAQQLNISVKSEEVRIDVLVTNQGKPVMGLTATDFEVLDIGCHIVDCIISDVIHPQFFANSTSV